VAHENPLFGILFDDTLSEISTFVETQWWKLNISLLPPTQCTIFKVKNDQECLEIEQSFGNMRVNQMNTEHYEKRY